MNANLKFENYSKEELLKVGYSGTIYAQFVSMCEGGFETTISSKFDINKNVIIPIGIEDEREEDHGDDKILYEFIRLDNGMELLISKSDYNYSVIQKIINTK